jgi:RNA polymerase sigma factor (sigma-70 family)
MGHRWLGSAMRDVAALFRDGGAAGLSDRELLARFAAQRDDAGEAAFAALVARHGPMVWGVCRRWLREPADVDDAFQATFLVLARRAGSIRVEHSLGPWLHGVSVRVAARARVVAVRHHTRERVSDELDSCVAVDPSGPDELRPVIDEELAQLPARYRAVLVVCYLEGLTHEEAAARLGCPVGTIRSRLARGRSQLRRRLERRGLAPAGVAQALGQIPALGGVAPTDLLARTTARSAVRLAAGQTLAGTVPASVATLVAGVSRTMQLSKLGIAATVLAVPLITAVSLAGTSALSRSRPAPARGPDVPELARPAPPAQVPAPATAPAPAPAPVAVALADEEKAGVNSPSDATAFNDYPAFVVKTVPPTGAIDVDPGLTEIQATYSREMADGSWSWTQGSAETFPKLTGKPHYLKDRRTCVLPVKLEPGKTYAIGLNSQRFHNFRDVNGDPATPYSLIFRTKKP